MFRKETKLYVLLVRGFLLFTLVASLPLHSQDTGGGFNDISPAGDAELDTINPAGAGDDTPVTPPAISPGDSTKAKQELGWSPKTSLKELIKEMISHDIKEAKKYKLLKKEGFQVNNENHSNRKLS